MRGKGNIILIVVISVLLVAGTSFALKNLGIGSGTSGSSERGSYKDNVQKASAGDPRADQRARGGCGSSGGGCNSKGGGCGSSGSGCGSPSGLSVEQVRAGVLKYYAQKYGDTDVLCEVKDFGCHMEAEILKDGKVLKRLSINGRNISEI